MVWIGVAIGTIPLHSAETYRHFDAAVYCRVFEVLQMKDPEWLKNRFETVDRYLKIGKVYLETHRDGVLVDGKVLREAKRFFESHGIRTAGGITLTIDEGNRFQTFCYTNPEHRKKIREVVRFTSRHFDEVILDDFFFTNCKCPSCIHAKGKKSWTELRLSLLKKAAEDLILKPARKANPHVTMVIKYPNWYEHFQGLGYHLEAESRMFDRIYTGTETRDAVFSAQHLQPYESYLIFRYFDRIKPGGNGGGWVDTGGLRFLDRYAEQLWLTLFAGAPEITLFDFRQLAYPIRSEWRAEWQGRGTSFDFDAMVASARGPEGDLPDPLPMALAAGYALEKADAILGFLGRPMGVACYRPYHAVGEDFLHNYLGMLGLSLELVPHFPPDPRIFLAESAAKDPSLVRKIRNRLLEGGTVIITSGLLRALQQELGEIVELRMTDKKALVRSFIAGPGGLLEIDQPILIPQIQYLTNDSWEEVLTVDGPNGWPLLHSADYGRGKLYVLIIPDNPADLYRLPEGVLARIRQVFMEDLPVRIDGPSQIALFQYDNGVFIVESFLPEESEVTILTHPHRATLLDLESEACLTGERLTSRRIWGMRVGEDRVAFRVIVKPHSFRIFRCE